LQSIFAAGRLWCRCKFLQEYFVAVTRKLGVAPEMAQRKVEILARSRVVSFEASEVIALGGVRVVNPFVN
jgi:predicted nucleic acid-binding protein